MSTDLHLHHELPKLRIAAVKIDDVPSPDHDISSVVTRAENENDGAVTVADDEESYRTPTSKESKIPAVLTCPPAPRKPKPFVSCKRKLLDEFQFFEVTSKEDMDAFFRSTFPKRSCPCT
ncbi:cyclin-dependent protein kinase inhibitor SMR1 [Abrus precatorius]|uniref:Cyclin-dependent protein kinase inhibitor SMR1 n=1 Tax=Abrus precatorius TaxID=3816 RepID=A0A8B8MI08_ABRPR|nr:cyclin-dependent protein kinase inhibitor SMR1 [Abrus precatorius]